LLDGDPAAAPAESAKYRGCLENQGQEPPVRRVFPATEEVGV
jgi:hypothetical protein